MAVGAIAGQVLSHCCLRRLHAVNVTGKASNEEDILVVSEPEDEHAPVQGHRSSTSSKAPVQGRGLSTSSRAPEQSRCSATMPSSSSKPMRRRSGIAAAAQSSSSSSANEVRALAADAAACASSAAAAAERAIDLAAVVSASERASQDMYFINVLNGSRYRFIACESRQFVGQVPVRTTRYDVSAETSFGNATHLLIYATSAYAESSIASGFVAVEDVQANVLNLSFTDEDLDINQLGGRILWALPEDNPLGVSRVDNVSVYLTTEDFSGRSVLGQGLSNSSLDLPADTLKQIYQRLAVYTVSSLVEQSTPTSQVLTDADASVSDVAFDDYDLDAVELGGVLSWAEPEDDHQVVSYAIYWALGLSNQLVAADHCTLDPTVSLQAAGLEDGDHLTAIVLEAKLASTEDAFALFCPGGDRVVTWGSPDHGGDSSEVQDQLKGVQQVKATLHAFAAILADGSAFAAILADGSVVTWGSPDSGGDSSEVQGQLKGVQQVQATFDAFAAILADESVVTWGISRWGGDSSGVKDQLKGVQQVQGTCGAFAAILADGSVVTWGAPRQGGDSSEVKDQLKGVHSKSKQLWKVHLLRSWLMGQS
eukprot:s528_g41.t1